MATEYLERLHHYKRQACSRAISHHLIIIHGINIHSTRAAAWLRLSPLTRFVAGVDDSIETIAGPLVGKDILERESEEPTGEFRVVLDE